jgi:hypothetical protein
VLKQSFIAQHRLATIDECITDTPPQPAQLILSTSSFLQSQPCGFFLCSPACTVYNLRYAGCLNTTQPCT